MSPGASQPLKKQRATATPKLSSAADDAIARRRAELRRLAQQQQHPQAPASTASTAASSSSSGAQPGLFSSFGSTAAGASGVVKTTTTTQNSTSNVARRLDSDFKGRGGGSTTSAASASRPATTTTTAPAKKSSPALSSASPWGRTLGVQTTTTTASTRAPPQTRSPPAQPTRIPSPKAQKSSPIAASSNNAFSTTQAPKNNNKEGMIEDIDEPPLANEEAPAAASPRSYLQPPSLSPSRGTTAAAPLNHNSRRMVPTSTNRGANPQTNSNNSSAPVVHSIVAQRLEQEVKEQEALKLKALRQVKELEDKLMELETTTSNNNKNNSTSETPLESFLELVDTVGEAQAMDWARSQVTGNSNGAAAAPTPYKKTNGKVSCLLVYSYMHR